MVEFEKVFDDKFDRLEGNGALKYAMALAISGRHNILIIKTKGKTSQDSLVQMFPMLMPKLSETEQVSVNSIWGMAGLEREDDMVSKRPFRFPHQTCSIEGMCGGGVHLRPGEISLAHNGMLLLENASEFRTSVLQMLRVPLESRMITLSRAGVSTSFPSNFQLAMTTDPCPCGCYGNKDRVCICSLKSIEVFWKKFSAPLLDRIAIRFDTNSDNAFIDKEYTLSELREMIAKAQTVQYERQGKLNADLVAAEVEMFIPLNDKARGVLDSAMAKSGMSARNYVNVMKVARTLADMNGVENVDGDYIKKALNFLCELPYQY